MEGQRGNGEPSTPERSHSRLEKMGGERRVSLAWMKKFIGAASHEKVVVQPLFLLCALGWVASFPPFFKEAEKVDFAVWMFDRFFLV